EGAADALDIAPGIGSAQDVEHDHSAGVEAPMNAAIERFALQAQWMARAVRLLARMQGRIDQDEVVALARALEVVPPVRDQDPRTRPFRSAEEIARYRHHHSVDLDHVEPD